MRALVASVVFLAGCSTTWDPHALRTIVAPEKGGAVEVDHGQRLLVKLPTPAQGSEWRPREPMTMVVIAEGPVDPEQGQRMTPVRSGKQTLRFEELPVQGEGSPQRVLSYEVTVP
jgi:hypothetical protein